MRVAQAYGSGLDGSGLDGSGVDGSGDGSGVEALLEEGDAVGHGHKLLLDCQWQVRSRVASRKYSGK